MKSSHRQAQGKGVFDLIEEATQLLRTASAATLAVYYVGAVPFALGFLYFWADMSRNPFAPQHLMEAALGMTGLYLWMKFWQTLFSRHLRAQLAGEPPPAWTVRRCARIFVLQTVLQPLGLFLIPIALLPVVPFAWVMAFFQNVTVLADGESGEVRKLAGRAWKMATLWRSQNHLALAIIGVFGGCVFMNWTVACLTLPRLIQLLSGSGSIFTESTMAMLNTTFLTGMLALTCLCVDPLLKAVYVLRCFYGESLKSGEDLKAEMKPFAGGMQRAAGILIVLSLSLWVGTPVVHAASAAGLAPKAGQIAPADLDHAISQTIHERKFTWRMPREQAVKDQADDGVLVRFFEKIGTLLRHWARLVFDWLRDLWKQLFPTSSSGSHSSNTPGDWMAPLQLLLYGLVAAVLIALALFLYRLWQGKRTPAPPVMSEAIQPVPDIRDENIRADQLPEDGWTRLAHELLERGEFRLAMRAFYLASLAHLAARNLISITRFKSNREYERELRRRGHAIPEILSLFGENVFVFERIWYGAHLANLELARQFAAKVDRIKTVG